MLLARESFFRRGENQLPTLNQTSRRVRMVGIDAQDVQGNSFLG